jgi:hypothetical protein
MYWALQRLIYSDVHGSCDPHGLASRVVTGPGTGQHLPTPLQPVPLARVGGSGTLQFPKWEGATGGLSLINVSYKHRY